MLQPNDPKHLRLSAPILARFSIQQNLSKSTRLVTPLSPSGGEKMSNHAVAGGDIAGLFARIGELRANASTGKQMLSPSS
ncbi:MAG: hypothetical protein E5X73_19800 [Mesorhizobium sp.]|nr:MAG: hypothetical protein E5Y77_27685 [Mesorhizobium sp.]TIP11033.1 MAG: hypothetical protein E5X73_19800 [Mesorhizobium sp.]